MSNVSPIASAMSAIEGGSAAVTPRRPSHSVISLALTTDASAMTAPIERSIPPAMMTMAAPTASTPKRATRCRRVWRLYALKKA